MLSYQHATLRAENSEGFWAIEGAVGGLTVLWGVPGVGKSFVSVSMAVSVGTGRPWMGRSTHGGGRVVYVAAEAAGSISHRIQTAWSVWRPAEKPWELDVYVVKGPVVVKPGPDLGELVEAIESKPTKPRLIVLDTLSRCLAGDENKQEDMGAFVRATDILRDRFPGCAVLVVHHANKKGGMRGSTTLLGAADAVWHLVNARGPEGKAGRELVMEADKLRDLDADRGTIRLRRELVPVSVWSETEDGDGEFEELRDSFGDTLKTVVVKPSKTAVAVADRLKTAAWVALASKPSIMYDEWRELCGGLSKVEFDGALSLLITYPGESGIEKGEMPGEYRLTRGDE